MVKMLAKRISLCAAMGLMTSISVTCAAAISSSCLQQALDNLEGLRPSYKNCLHKASQGAAYAVDCMNIELAYQDRRLNAAYGELMAKLGPNYQKQLGKDERTWIKYRNAICAERIYGVDQPKPSGLECTVEETGRRANTIKAWLFQQRFVSGK